MWYCDPLVVPILVVLHYEELYHVVLNLPFAVVPVPSYSYILVRKATAM